MATLVTLEEDYVSSEFISLLLNTFTIPGPEQLFSIAFVFTVETGFIPTSLVEHFDSINSNIQLAKMINSLPLNSFWDKKNNMFCAQLVMSNQLCHLIGVPNGDSLIITLCYSNISKCILLENDDTFFKTKPVNFSHLSLKYKNTVSVPIKCAILNIVTGLYPNLCGLPEELILNIMLKLEGTYLFAMMKSCKKLYSFAVNNQFIWKQKVIELKRNARNDIYPLTDDEIRRDTIHNWRENYMDYKKLLYIKEKNICRKCCFMPFPPIN